MKNKLLQIAALIFFCVGIFIAYSRYSFFSSSTEKVVGTVKEVVKKDRRSGTKIKTSYYPIFEFSTSDGMIHTIESNLATNPPQYEVGEKITLYYNPANPNDARPYSIIDSWIIPLTFISFGILLFWISALKPKNQ